MLADIGFNRITVRGSQAGLARPRTEIVWEQAGQAVHALLPTNPIWRV